VLNGDDSPTELRHRLRTAAAELEKSGTPTGSRGISDAEPSYSLKTVMDVIGGFFVAQCREGEDPLETTLNSLDRGDCDRAVMEADFLRRESFGSLVFEELGIRLLHCRTEGIPEPRAGVIQYPDPADTVLVLAAPVSAKQSQTHALSEIVIALTEYDDFVGVLATGNRREIQARLMTLFGQSAV
jgi:mannitol operon transcriptional antiterminator